MWEGNRHCYKHRDGMAATGIGLAAGLGGGALLLAAAESGALTRHPKLAVRAQARPSTSSLRRSSKNAFRVRAGRTTMHLRSASTLMYGQVQAPGQALTRCRTPKQSRWLRRSMAIRGSTPPLGDAISFAWRGIPPRSLVVATRARVSPSGVGRESVPPLTLKTATICYSLKKSITIWTRSAQHPKTP